MHLLVAAHWAHSTQARGCVSPRSTGKHFLFVLVSSGPPCHPLTLECLAINLTRGAHFSAVVVLVRSMLDAQLTSCADIATGGARSSGACANPVRMRIGALIKIEFSRAKFKRPHVPMCRRRRRRSGAHSSNSFRPNGLICFGLVLPATRYKQ